MSPTKVSASSAVGNLFNTNGATSWQKYNVAYMQQGSTSVHGSNTNYLNLPMTQTGVT